MLETRWKFPASGDPPREEEMDLLLEELYPNGFEDKRQFFNDPKSKLRLHLALDGCPCSMVWLAKKIFSENSTTDGISMEVAFRWLLKAARIGDEAAIGMLISKRRQCPQNLTHFVDSIIDQGYNETDIASTYAKRIANKFRELYVNADEITVANEIHKLISGKNPKSESVFSQCFQNIFEDLFALAVTIMVGGMIGFHYLSSFDHLLSAKLASAMNAFFAFLCTILLIVSIKTYSLLFTCNMYGKFMRLDARYRDRPLPFRLRMFRTGLKLHFLSLFCTVFMVILSVLNFGEVSLTVFSGTTYVITLVDLVKHLRWWSTNHLVKEHYIGRYPLLLKLTSAICMSCLFSLTKAGWRDSLVTVSVTMGACSILYLFPASSVFMFSFMTSEYSLILQGLALMKTLLYLLCQYFTKFMSKTMKIIMAILMLSHAFQKVPSGLLFQANDTSQNDVYQSCKSTRSLNEMLSCSRLEGMRINASTYVESIRLLSRSNLLEAAGLQTWRIDDGLVQLGVDSFEKFKVEIKLSTNYFRAIAVLDDDAIDLIRALKIGDYITVYGVLETARQSAEITISIHTLEYHGERFEIKRLGTAVRVYLRHVHDVLVGWKDKIHLILHTKTKESANEEL